MWDCDWLTSLSVCKLRLQCTCVDASVFLNLIGCLRCCEVYQPLCRSKHFITQMVYLCNKISNTNHMYYTHIKFPMYFWVWNFRWKVRTLKTGKRISMVLLVLVSGENYWNLPKGTIRSRLFNIGKAINTFYILNSRQNTYFMADVQNNFQYDELVQ